MRHSKVYPMLQLLASLVLISFAGCHPSTSGVSSSPVASPTSRPISLISPVEFFSPEQKRLSQHLNWTTGCFQIDYSGPQAWLGSKLEIWEHGKIEPRGGSFSTSRAESGEISISAHQEVSPPYAWRVTRVNSSRTSSSSTSGTPYSSPKLERSGTRVALIKAPLELKPGEEVAVWALMLFQTDIKGHDNYHPEKSVAEQAKDADWALVLKVALAPPEDR